MRAVVYKARADLRVEDVPAPKPGSGEVLLAVQYCGICGTDLHEYESGRLFYGPERPRDSIMGHEFSARVSALGNGVDNLAIGDLVTVNPGENCQECSFCRNGDEHLCQRPRGATGYGRPGGMAEYTTAAARRCVKLPAGTPPDLAALSEPLAVALHAVNRGLSGGLPETAFIAGAGPIGQLVLLALRHAGARRIVVSEPAAGRRERARRLGADVVLDPQVDPPGSAIKAMTEARGADLSIECVGFAQPLNDCFAATRRGGRIVIAGVFQQPYPIDLARLTLAKHQIIGSLGYREEFPQAANLISRHGLDVAPVVSHRVALAETPRLFREIVGDRGAYEKVLIEIGGG